MMKKFLFGTLGFVAMAAPAVAADLPARDLQGSSSNSSPYLFQDGLLHRR